jgi:hypothetical protein
MDEGKRRRRRWEGMEGGRRWGHTVLEGNVSYTLGWTTLDR